MTYQERCPFCRVGKKTRGFPKKTTTGFAFQNTKQLVFLKSSAY